MSAGMVVTANGKYADKEKLRAQQMSKYAFKAQSLEHADGDNHQNVT
jgi:hypothetical protein